MENPPPHTPSAEQPYEIYPDSLLKMKQSSIGSLILELETELSYIESELLRRLGEEYNQAQ